MTNNEMRVVIAKACGWKQNAGTNRLGIWTDNNGVSRDNIPDYLTDLNAMHKAEETLKGHNQWHDYTEHLAELRDEYTFSVHLTARQRAEAFLKTIGKWT